MEACNHANAMDSYTEIKENYCHNIMETDNDGIKIHIYVSGSERKMIVGESREA